MNIASGPEELGLIDLEKTDISMDNSMKVTIDDQDCQRDSRLGK